MATWPLYSSDSCFPIENLPFGVVSTSDGPYCATRIGDYVIDLSMLEAQGLFPSLPSTAFSQSTLNDFISMGQSVWRHVRSTLQDLYHSEDEALLDACTPASEIEQYHLPVQIGDYTDFYASKEHATNVGTMFRGPENALNPNWVHMPIGYHGRASSIVPSGTDIIRPCGQIKPKEGPPFFGPTEKLDFELEMAFIVGKENQHGHPIPIHEAKSHIFGLVLMNDWSARDIQAWEYVPLGPFLGKNFATTISPWIVTLDALEPFLAPKPAQQPSPLPYLQEPLDQPTNYDISLQVSIGSHILCSSNFKFMYWSIFQQLAHHTATGCNMRVGDLCGSGTISGQDPGSYGSLLELSWNGTKPITLPDGTTRSFLQDYDIVVMTGVCITPDGLKIGFGECGGQILPALPRM